MMNVSELKESKFLKKEDCPLTVTIESVSKENMAQQGAPEEMKFILNFKESKPMVLNSTNGQLIAHALNSPESDDWVGKQISLYNDPSVSFGGQLTGGIRVQTQPQTTAPQGQAAPTGGLDQIDEKDVPF